MRWVPEVGKNRINSFVEGRGDWCISRQRSWGVPIPVFYDRDTGNEVLLDEDILDHVQKIFAEQGSDAWWKLDEVDLLPDKYKDEADKLEKRQLNMIKGCTEEEDQEKESPSIQ